MSTRLEPPPRPEWQVVADRCLAHERAGALSDVEIAILGTVACQRKPPTPRQMEVLTVIGRKLGREVAAR